MLKLTRRPGEQVITQDAHGNQITIKVLSVRGDQVALGFDAAASTTIHREEIWERIQQEQEQRA